MARRLTNSTELHPPIPNLPPLVAQIVIGIALYLAAWAQLPQWVLGGLLICMLISFGYEISARTEAKLGFQSNCLTTLIWRGLAILALLVIAFVFPDSYHGLGSGVGLFCIGNAGLQILEARHTSRNPQNCTAVPAWITISLGLGLGFTVFGIMIFLR